MDTGEDIETILRQLLANYRSNGVDFVLGVCYTDRAGQRGYLVKHTGDKAVCRRVSRMLWQSLAEESKPAPAPAEEAEDD